jgi:hypothetical protein
MKRSHCGFRISLAGFISALLLAVSADAATITVISAADDGGGSLRQAISNAAAGDTINFSLPPGTAAITLTSDQLLINKNLTISGPGAGLLTVQRSTASGTPQFRIFQIASSTVTISGLTIANGNPTSAVGGGIGGGGTLTITNCTVSGNTAVSGGGISIGGTVTITNSTIAGNTASTFGGGIYFGIGTVTITNSTISGNTAGYGGGIYDNGSTLSVVSSTISNNTAQQGGGGILQTATNNTTLSVVSSTISGNDTSTGGGSGVLNNGGTVNVKNTIIAKNTGGGAGPDFNGTLTSEGYNLIGNTSGATITGTTTGNQLNVDPMLGPLQDNGGPTFTQTLLSGSPAIDAGNAGGLTADQRGFSRPVDSPTIANAPGGDGSDIGAYEVQGSQLPGCGNTVVTNNNDSGSGSLRSVVANACQGETVTFASSVVSPINLTSDQLVIDKDLTINGPGANLLSVQRSTVSGTPTFRIFRIVDPIDSSGNEVNISVTISGLRISNGSPNGTVHVGGAINSACTLTIVGCIITNNTASTEGGGIFNNDGTTVNVINSTISGNTATAGGGVENGGTGTVSITNSTVSGNTSSGAGGGIDNEGGTVNVTNSTISGNTASNNANGGGIENGGSGAVSNVTLINSTVSGNHSPNSGGGIANLQGTVTAKNTIIAKNTDNFGDSDIEGTLASQGYNLIGNSGGATITGTTTGNQLNVDPMLGPLQDNGGPTYTQALLTGSPATDKGSSSGISTDQRGFNRIVDSSAIPNASGGDGSDIGAFEDQDVCGTHVVTNNNDSGAGSLRDVIAGTCGGATVTFAPGVSSPINLTSGELVVSSPITIIGPGANVMTVQRDPSASSNFNIFTVTASGATNISGLTITKGNPNFSGGGVSVGSSGSTGNTLTITECVVTGNAANSSGALPSNGGGIFVGSLGAPALIIRRSTISGNSATQDGGGIAGIGTITNCTISGNSAARYGGGIAPSGTMTIINSTIANNTGATGGGVRDGGLGVTARNTIFAKNTATTTDPDFSGPLNSQGFNLIGNNTGTTITPAQSSDQIGTAGAPIDPLLGPLQNNGGPVLTLALLSGSRAIDKGDSSIDPITGNPITIDQRGVGYSRTVDDPSIPNAAGGDGTDIGAFEFGAHISVVSRKTHGTAGTFDVPLPLTGTSGIECRTGGTTGDHQLILTFPTSVTINGAPQAQVTTGTGQIGTAGSSNGGVVNITGGVVTIPLTNVSNAQKIAVTLFGVSDGNNTNDVIIPMGVLAGDTTANGSVNSSDIAQTQSQSGQTVTSSNFREDVTVNGSINSSDVAFVQSKSGTALPVGSNQSEGPITITPKHRTSPGKSF